MGGNPLINIGMDPAIIRRANERYLTQMSEEDLQANEWAKAQERRLKEREMEQDPREPHATEEEMLLGGESQAASAPRRDRNADIIERTLALAKRAEDLSGEVTYNSATETGTREKIDAFKAHMEQGVKMGQELMALFKA